ncbi:MAG: Gfo/Idh/MocA family oxidoreductase [Verrucomicrobiota bacterium]
MKERNPVKVGIVGCGRAGLNMHWGDLKSRTNKFQIVAAHDCIKARREKMAEETGCKACASFEAMIHDPEVELVVIASNTLDHVPQAVAALRLGKDVFLEKPIGKDLAEARKLMRAAEKTPGKLYVRHNRRFEPAFVHAREIIDSGILGDVHEIQLNRVGYQRRNDWQTLKECAGGQLLNWGPHLVDHALQFLESPVKELWSDLKQVAAAGDAEDHVRIIFKGENGRVVEVEISGGGALPRPVYAIAGSKGGLVTWDEQTFELKYLDPKVKLKPVRARKKPPALDAVAEELKWVTRKIKVRPKKKIDTDHIWDCLYDSIRRGKPFPITNEQSLAVMEVIQKIKKGTEF